MIEIKNRTGQVRLSVPVTEKAVYRKELMKEEYIQLGFSTPAIVPFEKGDYIDTGYGRFELLESVFPAANDATGGYDYELRFDSPLARWANFKLFYNRKGAKESNWSMTHLTQYFMEVVIANLKELGFSYNGTPYTFEIDHSVINNVSKPLTFDGTNIFDALTRIAEAWEAEWWVEKHVIKLGRCERADLPPVQLDGAAVASLSRNQGNGDYATRIYAFGSERNIPKNYRADESEVAVDGVVRRRLMLPAGTQYVDVAENMAAEDIVEAVVLFDDIYPQTTGTVGTVDSVTEEVDDGEGKPTGETQLFYSFTDPALKNFSDSYIIPGQDLHVVFGSGLLAGMDFGVELKSSDAGGTVFRIVPNTNYIVTLPNETLKPAPADTYTLYGFDTSYVDNTLLPEAEQKLLARAREYVKKSGSDPSVYTCVMNPVRAAGYVDDVYRPGQEIDLQIGQKVTLLNDAYFPDGHASRVYAFEKRLDNKYDCTYTVGETAQYSRLGELEGKMQSINYKNVTYSQSGGGNIYLIRGVDDTIPTDYNAFSALRTQKEIQRQSDSADNRYLFKDRPDQTDFLLGMNDGATFGNYLGGMLGSGAMIGRDGVGEMTGLKLREFLEVPELRFNRIDVVSGELWNSIAFGLIESVDERNCIVTLHLEEGELSGLHVNDFCRGIFHNLTGNAEQPGKDGSGFDTQVGFSTAYFTPVEIIDNARFKYELKPGTTVHPSASMKFAVYGNALDKSRQHSAYQTRTYTRFLRNVDTWEIDPGKHVSFQAGDLSNLVIDGQPLADGSVYLNNVYFGGNILTVGGLDKLKGKDAYSVTLSTYSAVYNIADGIYEEAEVVTKDQKVVTGESLVVASQFNVSTRLQVTKGEEQLRYSEVIGQGKYVVTSSGTNCTYVITDGLVAVQTVTADHAEIKIEVNCEGIAVYELLFTIVRVADGRDGKDYEYIFTCTPVGNAPAAPASEQADDFIPEAWTDDSVGPSIDLPYEWVSKRIKRNGVWGSFSTPSLWARFGEDGTDYEYIYTRTVGNSVPATPATSAKDDYVPDGWTDDPVGPTAEMPYEWVSKRSKNKAVWGPFSTPALWAKYAEDGTNHEFIYHRTKTYETPVTPSTSQKDDFVPENWTDDPVGVSAAYPYEWMSKRNKVKGVWSAFSDPSLWAKYGQDGTNGRYTEDRYRRSDTQPPVNGNPPAGWSLDPPASGTAPIWVTRATFNGDGTISGNWSTPVKWTGSDGKDGVTGPQGSQGIPGTSQYFHVKYSPYSNGNPMYDTPNTYIGTAVTASSTAPTSYTSYKWVRLEGAQGPQGTQGIPGTPGSDGRTPYLHIKYSNNGTSFTSNTGETPGAWIGQYVDFTEADSTVFSRYTWTKIKGEDGKAGPAMTYRGLFDPNKTYVGNDSRVDAVKFMYMGSYKYFSALTTAGAFSKIDPTDEKKWKSIGEQFESIATGFAFIEDALIAGWRFRENYIESQNHNVVLDGSVDSGPRIALGSSYADRKNAPTRLYENGEIYTKKLNAENGCNIGTMKIENGWFTGITSGGADDASNMIKLRHTKNSDGSFSQISLGSNLNNSLFSNQRVTARIYNGISNKNPTAGWGGYYRNTALQLESNYADIDLALETIGGRMHRGRLWEIEEVSPLTGGGSYSPQLNGGVYVFRDLKGNLSFELPSHATIQSMFGNFQSGISASVYGVYTIRVFVDRYCGYQVLVTGTSTTPLLNHNGDVQNDYSGTSYGSRWLSKGDFMVLVFYNKAWYIQSFSC